MKFVALAATLLALLVPATGLAAGADVSANRYCEYGDTPGVGITVERPNGGLLVCRVSVPGKPGLTVLVFHYKL